MHTFHRSFGNGRSSAVWIVLLSVLVQTDTGIVPPSSVCTTISIDKVQYCVIPYLHPDMLTDGNSCLTCLSSEV